LEKAAAVSPPAGADPRLALPVAELAKLPIADLVRLHRLALGLEGGPAAPATRADPEELDRLRALPQEELLRLHREALGL
jgi:hypothetical protein